MQHGAAKELHTRDIKSGLDLSDASLSEAWAAVRGEGPTSWATFTYSGTGTTKLAVDATGTGFDSLRGTLSDDKVTFGGVRVRLADGQSKFLSFLAVGEAVGGMKRGKAALHKNAVVNGLLEGTSGELVFASKEDFTVENASAQVKKMFGAEAADW